MSTPTLRLGLLALATLAPLPGELARAAAQAVLDPSAVHPEQLLGPIVQEAYLKASNTGPDDGFGASAALEGDTIAIGARGNNRGAVYVFVHDGDGWSQQARLEPSNGGAAQRFGESVALSGDTLVVGANTEMGWEGAAYVFVRNGDQWSEQAYLKGSNTEGGDLFGQSVDIEGDRIVIGARGESSGASGPGADQDDNSAPVAGAVYVFVRNGATWTQEAYLKASNPDPFDEFGISVALSGDTLAVGANDEDSEATGVDGNQHSNGAEASGAAYVFVRSGSSWIQQAYLKASNTGSDDLFGSSVAVSGDTLIVGSVFEDSSATEVDGDQSDDSATRAGAAYVFVRSGTSWSQQAYLKAANAGQYDSFGGSVAIDGEQVAVGASGESGGGTGPGADDDDSAPGAGAAYLFERRAGSWEQSAYLKASNTDAGDFFGRAVALEGGRFVVGASYEDSLATGVDGDQTDNGASGAGAAYVYDLDTTLGTRYCSPAVPNSTGQPGSMRVDGSTVVAADDLILTATNLPQSSNIGYFLMGTGMNTFTPPGATGPICVSPGILRLLPPVSNTNEEPGGFTRSVGTTGPQTSNITPGSTWNFQAWHRDSMAGTSNLTDAVSVTFQ